MNYSKEMTAKMVEMYAKAPNRQTVAILAKELGKSEKSIIGKLSKEGVYLRTVYKTKTGESPVTKQELVDQLEATLEVDLNGLEKAPKTALKNLMEAICND